jgi:hypothetical protein
MKTTAIIIDDFYNNPHDVREFALKQEFSVVGNYPGFRTVSHTNPSIYSTIQEAVKNAGGQITSFSTDSHNGSYQYALSTNKSWIHADEQTWAGICFLTPDAPLSSGTGLYRHKSTGLECRPRLSDGSIDEELLSTIYRDSQDMDRWELTDRLANKFNRLILYRGDYFHMSLDYFGTDLSNGRLFQTFFFDTEY